MSTVEDLRRQISNLEPKDAEELADWLFRSVGAGTFAKQLPLWLSGIEKTPDVCGGDARIIRTRIPVWVLEQFRRLGMSESEILRNYPTLRAEDLVHAWAYVELHGEEIDRAIRENEEA